MTTINGIDWRTHARDHLRAALNEIEGDGPYSDDVLIAVEQAALALRLDAGETAPYTMDPAAYSEWVQEPGPECICPPDLLARGGFKGRCPIHA